MLAYFSLIFPVKHEGRQVPNKMEINMIF